MPLAFQDVFYPFVGGLDESVEPKVQEQGFSVVTNGWYDKQGRIRKRAGIAPIVGTDAPSTATRLHTYENQLLASTVEGKLYAGRSADARFIAQDLGPELTVRRVRIRSEIDQSMIYVDMAVGGGYTVYAWINDDDDDCHYRIVETVTGTIVLTGVANSAAAAVTQVRLATSGTNVLLTYVDAANNDIYARRIVCSTNPPGVGAETALITDTNGAATFYDTCAMGTGWAIVYRTTTPDVRIRQIVSAEPPTLGWDVTGAADLGGAFDITYCACVETGGQLWVAMFQVAANQFIYIVQNSTTGASVLGGTLLEAAPAQPGPIGIAPVSSTASLFSWKSGDQIMRWRTGANTGTGGSSTHVNYRVLPESKPFYSSQTDAVYQWVRTNDVLVLVHLDRTIGSTTTNMRPVATAAFGVSGWEVGAIGTRIELGNIAAASAFFFRAAMRVQLVSGSAQIAADEVQLTLLDPRQHQSLQYGKALYISGGVLCQWDGVQLVENAFIQKPQIFVTHSAGLGSLAAGSYQLVAVYEEYDDNGEVIRSIPSEVFTIAATGGASRLVVTLWPLTITLRQDDAQTLPRVEVAIYVTEANLDVFYRHQAVGSAQANTFNNTTTYTPINVDSVSTSNPTLYTTGGVLENDAVYGGATIICEHKGRLFAAGGEDDEVVWYSQPRVDGEPALFNIAQQIRVSGHFITSLESLDDALIIFTKTGIFAVYGEGPNALGDPNSGSFTDPIPLASDVGCVGYTGGENHATAVCPAGVVFPTSQGIYLLDRGRSVRPIGDPVTDTFVSYRGIRATEVVPSYGHVRLLATHTDNERTRVLVWDYVEDKWAVWSYLSDEHFIDAAMVASLYTLWRSDNRFIYAELPAIDASFSDAGSWYGLSLTTGDITFGTGQTLKRLQRVNVLFERIGTAGMTVELVRNSHAFGTADHSQTSAWTEAEVTALAEDSVRLHVAPQKGRAWRFRISETEPAADDAGLALIGLNFKVGTIGGPQRLSAADSK